MIILFLGLIAFTVLHLAAVSPAIKGAFKYVTGERLYGPVYGLSSVAALAIIAFGWPHAPTYPVYDVLPSGWYINYALTFIAFLLLGIFLFRGSLRQKLRFPMAYATLFWGVGHLFANGDERSVFLFGGMIIGALLMLWLGYRNGIRPSADVRQGHDGLSLLAGAALYGVMTQLHGALIGVPVFALS